MLAFLTGFEVECKISEWMLPQHYVRGMHSSGTVGTFERLRGGGKTNGLDGGRTAQWFWDCGKSCGGHSLQLRHDDQATTRRPGCGKWVTAALLAARGFTADPDALGWPLGILRRSGWRSQSAEKIAQGFGEVWTIVEPGVSIKPYPCGVLTHPTIDLMLKLVTEHDVKPDGHRSRSKFTQAQTFSKPIRYPIAANHLQAKFSLPAALAMIALARKAGKREFSDEFVGSAPMQAMQRRISTELDAEIEKKWAFDKDALAHRDSTERRTHGRRLGR